MCASCVRYDVFVRNDRAKKSLLLKTANKNYFVINAVTRACVLLYFLQHRINI